VAGDVNESLSKTNKELDDIVKKLAGIEKSLKTIGSSSSKLPGAVRGATKGGGEIGVGSTSTSMMPHMGKTSFSGEEANQEFMNRYKEAGNILGLGKFSTNQKALGIAQGVAQIGMGFIGGALAAVPSVTSVMASSANYYGASIRSGGLGYQQITNMTMQGLGRLGITGEQSPAATAAILAARGVMPGSAQYKTLLGEIGGAARYMNMANENAAVALSGLTQGQMSSRLYSVGVSTFNQQTGQFRGGSEVMNQLLDRMTFGREKASVQDVMNSIQGGFLQQTANSLGMSEDQKQLFYQTAINRAGGNPADLAKLGINGNPLESQKRIVQSDVETLNRYVQPVLKGMENAADIVEAFNRGLQSMADQLGYVSGLMGGLGQSRAGAGIGAATGGFLGGMGQILGAIGISKLAGKAGGALKGGFKNVKGFLKGGLGRLFSGAATYAALEQGQDFLNRADVPDWLRYLGNLAYDAGQGGLTGLMAGKGNPYAGLAGVVAGTGGAVVNPYGGKGGPSGYAFGASFGGTNQTQGALSAPIAGGYVSATYGQKGKMWKGKHTGNDYPCPIGTPVQATLDGVVYSDNPGSEYGKTVQIDHGNGYQTLFGHLSEVLVKPGQAVKKGDVIGKSGDTGNVDGPHVHYEVRRGKNNPVNPDELKSGQDGGSSIGDILGNAGLSVGVSGIQGADVALSKALGSGTTTSLLNTNSSIIQAGMSVSMDRANSGVGLSTGISSLPSTADPDLVQILKNAGFSGASLATAYGIVKAESGGRAKALNDTRPDLSYGLFQINMIDKLGPARRERFGLSSNEDLFDPNVNARVAYQISNGGTNFKPWTTYTSGKYKQFVDSMPSGGSTGLSVATPSVGYNVASPNITINATFNNATEYEAKQLVAMVKRELENTLSVQTMGRS